MMGEKAIYSALCSFVEWDDHDHDHDGGGGGGGRYCLIWFP